MTKQEKIVIWFLVGLLVLGLVVKFYKARAANVNLKVEKISAGPGKIDVEKIAKEKGLIKINTAVAADFARLPGIGQALAQRIVDYRDKNGVFFVKEDLKKVRGIGEKKYEAIKDYITVE